MGYAFVVTFCKRQPGKRKRRAVHSEVAAPTEKDARLSLVAEYNRRGFKVLKIEEAEKEAT